MRYAADPVLRVLTLLTATIIAVRILGSGYVPEGEALPYAALVASGKTWDEILVTRPGAALEIRPGVHAALEVCAAATRWPAIDLARALSAALFVTLCLPALLLLRRPESWILSLLVLAVAEPRAPALLLQGRPAQWTAAVLVLGYLVWVPRERTVSRARALVAGGALAAAFFVDPGSALLSLPVALLTLGQRRAVGPIAGGAAVGLLLAALASGRAAAFLAAVAESVLGVLAPPSAVAERAPLQPGAPLLVLFVAGLLLFRALQGRWEPSVLAEPAFRCAMLIWALGFVAPGLWTTLGIPAVLVFMARELQGILDHASASSGLSRSAFVAAACIVGLVAWTSDVDGRWSRSDGAYLPLAEPSASAALPDAGGVLYSDDPRLFGQLFARQPRVSWRYVVGFDPEWMRPEDLAVWHALRRARTPEAFAPWVQGMRGADRLIILGPQQVPPVSSLTWSRVGEGLWSGRVLGSMGRE